MPQPADGHLTLRFALRDAAQVVLEVYAVDGTLAAVAMMERSFEPGGHTETVMTSALRPGSYTLQLRAGAETRIERFVVVR
jgi:hypothetical protein